MFSIRTLGHYGVMRGDTWELHWEWCGIGATSLMITPSEDPLPLLEEEEAAGHDLLDYTTKVYRAIYICLRFPPRPLKFNKINGRTTTGGGAFLFLRLR